MDVSFCTERCSCKPPSIFYFGCDFLHMNIFDPLPPTSTNTYARTVDFTCNIVESLHMGITFSIVNGRRKKKLGKSGQADRWGGHPQPDRFYL